MKRTNHIGKRFGRLIVLSRTDRKIKDRIICFLFCECKCGIKKEFRYDNLINKTTISCGCFQRENVSKRSRGKLGESVKRATWHYYKRNAKTRNIDWCLNFEEFCKLILGPCHYCGVIGRTKTVMRFKDTLSHNGIDRFYNDKAYTKKNSITCCKICNMAKSNLHPKEFESWILDVYGHLFEGDL
jgi:hypothetical protein